MAPLEKKDRFLLLKLARSVIASELMKGKSLTFRPEDINPSLNEKRGCFVTLHKGEALRGCIGTIEPTLPLFSCIKENAINAAFRDPRFPPLKGEELDEVDIEISLLTIPKVIKFESGEDLKDQIIPGVHGVILSHGHRRATFLPQVWKQLPHKEDFLENLCLKGGMPRSAWRELSVRVEVYEAECFSEKQLLA